jgi:hypothetical protein
MKTRSSLKPYTHKVRGKTQQVRGISSVYHTMPRLTTIHKLVLGQNLSDIPGESDWHLTAFLISYAQYDIARMSDDELEFLAAGLPCGGQDA